MFSTKYKLNALIQKKAHLKGISLSTPLLIEKVDKNYMLDQSQI